MKNRWYKAKVIRGKNQGKNIGFPTINLDNSALLKRSKKGVYLSHLKINQKDYYGLLYYGPRLVLNETRNILEIFILDFSNVVYGKIVKFRLMEFIRGIMNFSDIQELKKQIEKDLAYAREMIKYK